MERVRLEFTKWQARPHWEYDAVRLGSDQHGTWLGVPAGTRVSRPGADFRSAVGSVVLVPDAQPYIASFYEPGFATHTYVDISTLPQWQDGARRGNGDRERGPDRDGVSGRAVVRAVDLDLDVVRGPTGRVWVDDEDEFAAHRVQLGYPEELVELALATCQRVLRAVEDGVPPFDPATAARWLERLLAPAPTAETPVPTAAAPPPGAGR
ncbi:MAG TPA: DUF402 domain-containing protein [Nocardioidaceae bacterium]|jgi:hypothetical protein|nr:DUF402 domain-containing protein [Nocardioidaceae bacterium]